MIAGTAIFLALKQGGSEMLTINELRQFSGTEHLCGTQHKCSYVA
jgi:hypothetical protein